MRLFESGTDLHLSGTELGTLYSTQFLSNIKPLKHRLLRLEGIAHVPLCIFEITQFGFKLLNFRQWILWLIVSL